MAPRDPAVTRKIRVVILLAAAAMALIGLLAVADVLKFGRLAGYVMIGIALIDVIVAMVVFRDREA
jgi:hypothetical protein